MNEIKPPPRRQARTGEAQQWFDEMMADPPDQYACLLWPFAVNGRGHAALAGTTVGRIVLGLTPGDGVVARHTCNNAGCVNPAHFVAGTAADNSRDMVKSGRSLAGDRNPNWQGSAVKAREPHA